MERDSTIKTLVKRTVNNARWAREHLASLDCQERDVPKAFTGKGTLRELRQLVAELELIEKRMLALSEASKKVKGASLYLYLHRRKASDYTFLRWRSRAEGGSNRHMAWEEATVVIDGHALPQAEKLMACGQEALRLNGCHKSLRERIRYMRQAVTMEQRPTFSRPIPLAQT